MLRPPHRVIPTVEAQTGPPRGCTVRRTSNDQSRGQGLRRGKKRMLRDRVFWERSVCPASWFNSSFPPTQHLVKAEYFPVFLTRTARKPPQHLGKIRE